MAKNTMRDLQDHLFMVIEGLRNNSDPEASDNEKMDLETAKAIASTAKVIIDSAKTEVDFLRVLSGGSNPELLSRRSGSTMLGAGKENENQ